ncbi:MAG: hypothetical protein IPO78_12450 [Saprospiraceae bacterium]|nr:hypothetical protein [Saprospiraceae bacterium]MBK9722409.1 hypothetical protein [Saprospiraceae bacterium]
MKKKIIPYFTIGLRILDGPLPFNIRIFIFFLILSIFSACKSKTGVAIHEKSQEQESHYLNFEGLPNDFKTFYQKFHTDSVFQMEHIVFPLEGLPDHADPEDVRKDAYYYTADQWVLHTSFDRNDNVIYYINMANVIIEERIQEKKYQLMIIRRFAKASGGWRLIYYGGLNKYTANQ